MQSVVGVVDVIGSDEQLGAADGGERAPGVVRSNHGFDPDLVQDRRPARSPLGRILRSFGIRLQRSMTAKETVRALLDRLPEDCTLDDVQYHLYVMQAVRRGVEDGEAGRVVPHEQVAADLRRKWLLGSAT